jgi:hypothetical protein
MSEEGDMSRDQALGGCLDLDITCLGADNDQAPEIGHGSEITGGSRRDSHDSLAVGSTVTESHPCDDRMASQVWDDDGRV